MLWWSTQARVIAVLSMYCRRLHHRGRHLEARAVGRCIEMLRGAREF